MSKVRYVGFSQSIKGKIIIASFLAVSALFLAWATSKFVFEQMLDTVENIAEPSERLRIVNNLSLKIISLDQLQKSQAFHNPGNYKVFLDESKQLSLSIDTLKKFYEGDSLQLDRIASMQVLLKERDKLFINYLKVREGLLNNQSFSSQIESLNSLVEENSRKTDSTILESEKRTLVTTIYNLEEKQKEEEQKGFFNKLFGKKKPVAKIDPGYNIVNEELNVRFDTLELSKQDSILRGVGETMRTIEKSQLLKSKQFLNRENSLTNTGDLLINKMLSILRKVEIDAVNQIERKNKEANIVVNKGIRQISIIMVVFFLVTIILLYLILTDITRNNKYRKQLELAKEEAEFHSKARQRFLSNMSHEIRTPLQSIIGYSDIIKNQSIPDQKHINAISHSSEHLMQIVNEILDYNRIISGKFTFSAVVFDMEKLLEEVISVMKLQAERKNIKLYKDFDLEGSVLMVGDAFRLKQILYNLIGNAIKFTEKGHVALNVSYKKQGNNLHFHFSVEDTGIGLSEEETTHIFNEFEQTNNGEKSATHDGAGLGLTIAKALVENQGGRISVKSKLGEGSTFTFYLRFDEASEEAIHLAERLWDFKFPNHQKVWVIDDDAFILDLCSTILANHQIKHTCFNEPAKLLAADWDHEVKFIFMDMRMPGMSGTELCALLRKQIPTDVKIIALTAQVLPEEREQVLNNGFDALLMKPFREKDLIGVLKDNFSDDDLREAKVPQEFNIDILKTMTFGDQNQLNKILHQFVEDCLTDKEELLNSINSKEYENIILIVHRLAGRTAQAGAGKLAREFRLMELKLNEKKSLGLDHQKEIENLLDQLLTLTKEISKYTS
jgi:signal transduction histidine kinase/CheY-like chemotaxis protein